MLHCFSIASYYLRPNLELHTGGQFFDKERNVADQLTVQMQLSVLEDKYILDVVVQDTGEAMPPIESDRDPMEEDEQNGNDQTPEKLIKIIFIKFFCNKIETFRNQPKNDNKIKPLPRIDSKVNFLRPKNCVIKQSCFEICYEPMLRSRRFTEE